MSGILSLLDGSSLGRGLAMTAQMAARPTFELQFSMLQNALIDQLNRKITEYNQQTDRIDAFLVLEQVRLTRTSEALAQYKVEIDRSYNALAQIGDDLFSLGGLVDGAADDPTAFDALLGKINQVADIMKPANGVPLGVLTDDGIGTAKRQGVVTVIRDGETVKVTSFADFADADEARTAIEAAQERSVASLQVLGVKAEAAAAQAHKTSLRLSAVRIDISAQTTTDSAERAAKIQELQDQYTRLLKTLSVSFEGQQAVSEQLTKSLFLPPDFDKGSILNMFT